jgi:adenylate cyclase
MHTGPAVHREGDWFGATVNVAARVAGLARAGEVLLSGATLTAAESDLHGVVFDARGVERLRHVAEPIDVYAVRLEGPRLIVDPVCHMALDPERAAAVRERAGTEHYFCSNASAETFECDPQRHLRTS